MSSEEKKPKEKKPKKPKPRHVPFYHSKAGVVYESIYLDTEPFFLYHKDGLRAISDIYLNNVVLKPTTARYIPYKPYFFNEVPNTTPSYDNLYNRIYDEVDLFIVTSKAYKHLITSFIILSYHQEKFLALPYLFPHGDTESGKTTVLRLISYLGYRPMFGTSFPSADIFSYLGMGDIINGLILEDEIQGLEKDKNKLKIYKQGYQAGAKVPRMMKDTRQILFYNCFGLKAVGGEQFVRDKGFMRRCITIYMIQGKPTKRLTKATKEDFKRFSQIRNDLLVWRLTSGLTDTTLDGDLQEMGSLGELWEPIMVVAKGTKGWNPLRKQVKRAYISKLQREKASFEGYLAKTLMELGTLERCKFSDVWLKLLEVLDAELVQGKPHIMVSDDFGEITKVAVGLKLKGAFGGVSKTRRYGGEVVKVYEFDEGLLEKTLARYKNVTTLLDLLEKPTKEVEEKPEKEPSIPTKTSKSSNVVTQNDIFKEFTEEASK